MQLCVTVTIVGHPVANWGKLVARAMVLLVMEIGQCTYTPGMPSTMQGVMRAPLLAWKQIWTSSFCPKTMILQGVRRPISCIGGCYANDPEKGRIMATTQALDLTTSLRGDCCPLKARAGHRECNCSNAHGLESPRTPLAQIRARFRNSAEARGRSVCTRAHVHVTHTTEHMLYTEPTATTIQSIVLVVQIEKDAIVCCAQLPTHWHSSCGSEAGVRWGTCTRGSGRAQARHAVRVPRLRFKVIKWVTRSRSRGASWSRS